MGRVYGIFRPKRGKRSKDGGAVTGKRGSLIKCPKGGVICRKVMQRWPSLISLLERNTATSFSHHFNEIVNYQLLKLLERCKGGTSFNWPKIAEILYFWRKKIEDDCCIMFCS